MKTKMVYMVSPSPDADFTYYVTAQRGDKTPELVTRFKVAAQLNEAIGLAVKMAIQSKHDYGNNNVFVVIQPDICSISEPMIKI